MNAEGLIRLLIESAIIACFALTLVLHTEVDKRLDALEEQVQECIEKTEGAERRMDVQMDIFAGIIKDAKETW